MTKLLKLLFGKQKEWVKAENLSELTNSIEQNKNLSYFSGSKENILHKAAKLVANGKAPKQDVSNFFDRFSSKINSDQSASRNFLLAKHKKETPLDIILGGCYDTQEKLGTAIEFTKLFVSSLSKYGAVSFDDGEMHRVLKLDKETNPPITIAIEEYMQNIQINVAGTPLEPMFPPRTSQDSGQENLQTLPEQNVEWETLEILPASLPMQPDLGSEEGSFTPSIKPRTTYASVFGDDTDLNPTRNSLLYRGNS